MISKEERNSRQKEIRFYDGFPQRIDVTTLLECQFLREVMEFDFYSAGVDLADCRDFLLAPQKSDADVLPLSVNLYGYYNERHVEIRSFDKNTKYYPLYLNCSALYNKIVPEVELMDEKGKYTLYNVIISFIHSPVQNSENPDNDNYWHFMLDELLKHSETGNVLQAKSLSHGKKKCIGKAMLSYILESGEVICPKNNLHPYFNKTIEDVLRQNRVINS